MPLDTDSLSLMEFAKQLREAPREIKGLGIAEGNLVVLISHELATEVSSLIERYVRDHAA